MPYYYQSGEEIRNGDRVPYGGEAGGIEFVADRLTGDPELDWFVTEYGGGVMFLEREPKVYGRVFLDDTQKAEELVFVSRATDNPRP